ncbi:hypothetical protein HHL22_19340 [Hymenobacter sp. RP-2-7]|uniref:Lipoprotein n=1 Tax=Hymenobacter polaris TaxID=2682546 RepID=A0A7Y0FNV3_9BACT|nr:hypothetical protein [Hymenobacter polaris]NML67362.1 hypothetical protein [Hymenobacter polaris]
MLTVLLRRVLPLLLLGTLGLSSCVTSYRRYPPPPPRGYYRHGYGRPLPPPPPPRPGPYRY